MGGEEWVGEHYACLFLVLGLGFRSEGRRKEGQGEKVSGLGWWYEGKKGVLTPNQI